MPLGGLHARQARHVHVEETDVRPPAPRTDSSASRPLRAMGHDLQTRARPAPAVRASASPQQGFVVGHQGGRDSGSASCRAHSDRPGIRPSAVTPLRLHFCGETTRLRIAAEGSVAAVRASVVQARAESFAGAGAQANAGIDHLGAMQRPSTSALHAQLRCSPPSSLGSMPWRTAFSTRAQQGHRRAGAGRAQCLDRLPGTKLQAVGHPHVHDLEVGAHQVAAPGPGWWRARAGGAPRRAGRRSG